MKKFCNDGYLLPSDPMLYKQWLENENYNSEKEIHEIKLRIEATDFEKGKFNDTLLVKIASSLKCKKEDIIFSVSKLKNAVSDLSNNLTQLEINKNQHS